MDLLVNQEYSILSTTNIEITKDIRCRPKNEKENRSSQNPDIKAANKAVFEL